MEDLLFEGNQKPGKAQVAPQSSALSTLACYQDAIEATD